MLHNESIELMEKLKLWGMQSVYDEELSDGRKSRSTPEKVILEMLKAEAAERHIRNIRYRMGQARFPAPKDIDSFDFKGSSVDENNVQSLYQGDFIEQHINLIFVGGTCTGKTHLATAIAAQAIRDGKKCKFYNLVDLANELEQEKMTGFAGRISAPLLRFDMVLLDELGYLPFSKNGTNCFFISYQSSMNKHL